MFRGSLLVVMGMLAVAGSAMGSTLNFDDVTLDNGYATMPSTYGGLNFSSGWWVVNSDQLSLWGNDVSKWPSLNNAAYNNAAQVTITSSGYFSFDGASFTGWGFANGEMPGWTATSVTIQGYLGKKLVDTITVNLDDNGYYDWVSETSSIKDINKLVFTAVDGDGNTTNWLMDNLKFSAGVPEPMTMGLLLAGTATALLRRRKAA